MRLDPSCLPARWTEPRNRSWETTNGGTSLGLVRLGAFYASKLTQPDTHQPDEVRRAAGGRFPRLIRVLALRPIGGANAPTARIDACRASRHEIPGAVAERAADRHDDD
ncbi:hypothetical protein BCEN4_590035 [Burkholderia cenocepacia]|nr:hypothetical protein BCEN4_590035 [Burkholderia cenocepacia]